MNLNTNDPRRGRDFSPLHSSVRDKSPNSTCMVYQNMDQIMEQKDKFEQENHLLRKQMRQKEADFIKIEAVLQQKVQLLELQVIESQEREDNLKKVQEKMIAAFNPSGGNGDSQFSHQAEIQNEMQSMELKDLKQRYHEQIQSLESQTLSQKSIIQELSNKSKLAEEKLEQQKFEYDQLFMEQQLKVKELQLLVEQLQEEKIRLSQELESNQVIYKQNMDYYSNEKKKLRSSSGKKVRDYEHELERIRNNHDIILTSLKQEQEKERKLHILQVEKLEQQLRSIQIKNDSSSKNNISDIQNKYLKEIQDLNQSLSSFKKQTEEEIQQLKRDKEEYFKKCEYQEKDIQSLKQKLKKSKDDLQRQKQLEFNRNEKQGQQNEERNQEIINKYKMKIGNLKSHIGKLEQSEKKLKNMIIDKENEHEQELVELKRLINAERKKFKDLQESSQQFKQNYEKLQDDIYRQVKEKDKKLNFMSNTIKDLQSQLNQFSSCQQTITTQAGKTAFNNVIRGTNLHLDYSPEAHREIMATQNMFGLTNNVGNNSELGTQQNMMIATKILELGQEIICGACGKKYGVKLFLEHMDHCNPKAQFENRQIISKEFINNNELAATYYGDEGFGKMNTKINNNGFLKQSIQSSLSSLNHNPLNSEENNPNNQGKIYFDSNVSSVQYQSSTDDQNPHELMPPYNHMMMYMNTQKKNEKESTMNLRKSVERNQPNTYNNNNNTTIHKLTQQLDELRRERDCIQQDLDRTVLELKRTKIELALCEERKSESETCYKNEIKYLIDKLLKTKSKLNKERQAKAPQFESDDESLTITQNDNNHNNSSFVSTSFISQMKSKMPLQHSNSNIGFNQQKIYMKNIISSNNDQQCHMASKGHRNSKSTTKLYKNQHNTSQTDMFNNRNKILLEMEQKALQAIQDHNRDQQIINKNYDRSIPNRRVSQGQYNATNKITHSKLSNMVTQSSHRSQKHNNRQQEKENNRHVFNSSDSDTIQSPSQWEK